ncbi:unnamed protein product [Auanema sp. JU1783]|nr:unnamed protein product [Auanema sp. JU1783]
MQSFSLLLVALVPLSLAAPIETSTSDLQINIQHADQEVQNVLTDIQNLNEAVQAASGDGVNLNVEAVNELVADVKEQLENVQNDEQAEELKEQLHTVLNDAAEVVNTEEAQASPQDAESLNVLHEAIEQLAAETDVITTSPSQEGEISTQATLLDATQANTQELDASTTVADTVQNDATEELAERVEILPVLSENNDDEPEINTAETLTIIENLNDEGSGQEQNDDIAHNENNELLNESIPAHEDKTTELVFADQETTHQQIEIEAVDPLAEQLVINIPLRFTVDQILSRLNRMVFKSPTNERLYIAMKLTEMSHSLMRSVDSEMDEAQRIR